MEARKATEAILDAKKKGKGIENGRAGGVPYGCGGNIVDNMRRILIPSGVAPAPVGATGPGTTGAFFVDG